MITTISSQRYINYDIVNEKIENKDFVVIVSPVFEVDGESYRVILDGHHSLAAAMACEIDPVYVEANATEHDAILLLECGRIDDFLRAVHMGDDYYDIDTNVTVW